VKFGEVKDTPKGVHFPGDFSVDTEIKIESLESRPNEDIDITAQILKKKEENLKI